MTPGVDDQAAIVGRGSDVPETSGPLAAGIARWGRRLIPDPERAERLADDLRADAAETGGRPVDEHMLGQLEAVCHRTARHLTLELAAPAEPDRDVVGWPAVPPEVVRRRGGFISRVLRLDDGCGLLRIDGFDDGSVAAGHVLGAFAVLAGVDGLILDLRANGGGALSTLTLTAEYVLGTGVEHLSTVRFRDRPERRWWTTGLLGRTRLPTDVPVAVLIGPGTYFSGEALAYHLHTRDRVRLFGHRTPGAADHVTPVRVTPSVVALIPEGTPTDAVSGTNWEGTGVGPDVECPADEAEAVAMAWLLDVMGRAG